MIKYLRLLAVLFITLALSSCQSAPEDLKSVADTQPPITLQTEPIEPLEPAIPVQANPILSPADAGFTEEPESIVALVNKYNHLSPTYAPEDLVYVQIPFSFNEKIEKRMMRKEAAAHLEALVTEAQEKGLFIYGVSGYRSYDTQASIFRYNVGRFGSEQEANRISARAGESEHQTGLAMDVTSAAIGYSLTESFAETPEFAWLKENAHRFGFHIRYPLEKESITGYMYEPWHIRYFGQELATALYEAGVTYEEFLAMKV